MKCSVCELENEPGDRYCSQCGAPLEQESQKTSQGYPFPEEVAPKPVRQRERKSRPQNKKLVIAVCCVAAVVLAVLAVAPRLMGGKSGPFRFFSDKSVFMLPQKDDLLAFTTKGSVPLGLEEYSASHRWDTVDDWTTYGFIGNHDAPFGGTLYVVTAQGKTHVAEDVLSADLSADGTALVYTTDVQDGIVKLYHYNIAKDVSTLVTENCQSDSVVIAPDGKSLAYTTMKSQAIYGELYVDGKTQSLGKNCVPVAVSKGGQYVYYTSADVQGDALYVLGGGTVAPVRLAGDMGAYIFNRDATQILYGDGANFYYSENGGEGVVLSRLTDAAHPITPAYAQAGLDDLKGKIYYDNQVVYSLDTDLTVRRVATDMDYGYAGSDGKSFVYLKNEKIYYIPDVFDPQEPKPLVEEKVFSLNASSDLKNISFKDEAGAIYWVNAKGKAQKLADKAESYQLLLGDYLYWWNESESQWWYSHKGKTPLALEGIEGETYGVASWSGDMALIFTGDGQSDDPTHYYTIQGKTVTPITVQ